MGAWSIELMIALRENDGKSINDCVVMKRPPAMHVVWGTCLEYRASWARVPPEAAHFSMELCCIALLAG